MSFIDLVEGHLCAFCQHFRLTSSVKLLGQFELNFIYRHQAKGGKTVYILGLGHITKMAAMPIYDKNL